MGEPILGQEENRVGIFKLIQSLLFLPINLITMPFRMWVKSMIAMIGCGLAVVVVVVLVVIFVVLD
jgi:hypothetical protein